MGGQTPWTFVLFSYACFDCLCLQSLVWIWEWNLIWLFLQLESNEGWINTLCWTFHLKNTLKTIELTIQWLRLWILADHHFKSNPGRILQAEEYYKVFQLFCCCNYTRQTVCRCSGAGTNCSGALGGARKCRCGRWLRWSCHSFAQEGGLGVSLHVNTRH